MSVYIGEENFPEKTIASFKERVELSPNEAVSILIDDTIMKSGKKGFASTESRIVRYYKRGSFYLPYNAIREINLKIEKGMAAIRIDLHETPEGVKDVIPMLDADEVNEEEKFITLKILLDSKDESAQFETVIDRVREKMSSGSEASNHGVVTAIPAKDAAAKDAAEDEEFILFHAKPGGRGADLMNLLIILLVIPIIAVLFIYFPSHAILQVVFGLVLLCAPIFMLYALYQLVRPGKRKKVYGINSQSIFRTLLHGENHKLWNATTCPGSYEPTGMFDENLSLVFLDFNKHDDTIMIKTKSNKSLLGTPSTPHEVKISRYEFEDPAEFDKLWDTLRKKAKEGRPKK